MPNSDILSRCPWIRRTKKLAAISFFIAVYTDCAAIALVQSLAPAVLKGMYFEPCNYTLCQNDTSFKIHGRIAPSKMTYPTGSVAISQNIVPIPRPPAICKKTPTLTKEPTCVTPRQIMELNAARVGSLGSIGPMVELVTSPAMRWLLGKTGHRFLYLMGGVIQFAGSFQFMLAKKHSDLVIARGAFQGSASTLVGIAGVAMVGSFFSQEETSMVLGLVYAIGHPIAALTISIPGNAGFQHSGPYIPFGILAFITLVDVVIRLVVVSWKQQDVGAEGYETLEEEGSQDEDKFPADQSNIGDSIAQLSDSPAKGEPDLPDGTQTNLNANYVKKDENTGSAACNIDMGKDDDRRPSVERRIDAHEANQLIRDGPKSGNPGQYSRQRNSPFNLQDSHRDVDLECNSAKPGEDTSIQSEAPKYGTYGTGDSTTSRRNSSKVPENSHNDKEIGQNDLNQNRSEIQKSKDGSYLGLLKDISVVTLLLTAFIECLGVHIISATSPNWLINVLNAQQWQIGVVFGLCGAVQLTFNMVIGKILTRERLWLVLLFGNALLVAAFLVYPHCPSVWVALVPEICYRLAGGIVLGIASNFLSITIATKSPSSVNKGAILFTIAATSGAACGALSGGMWMQWGVSLLNLYTTMAVISLICVGAPYYVQSKGIGL